MTGVEIFLLLVGCIFMVGSFFITEKLSPSELNKIAELSQAELKRIVNNEINNAGPRIEEAVDNQIDASSDTVQRALEKETNSKIMAISEYSDTIIEEMNKTHNEIMFLYSMLNDKHAELTGMTSDLQRLAADIRNLQETAVRPVQKVQGNSVKTAGAQTAKPDSLQMQSAAAHSAAAAASLKEKGSQEKEPAFELSEETEIEEALLEEKESNTAKENHNQDILLLHKEGLSAVEIAKKLSLGVGEVKLVIGLYRGEIEL